MTSRQESIRQKMNADHAASLALLQSFTDAQWATPVPSEEEAPWTAKDVLIHLAVSEAGILTPITRYLNGEPGVPADFDLSRYNRSSVKKRADKTVPELLTEIEAAHAALLAKLETLSEADLDKTGRHARGDTLTIEGFFLRTSEHRLLHAQELQKAVGG
jgi:hypothetical protein